MDFSETLLYVYTGAFIGLIPGLLSGKLLGRFSRIRHERSYEHDQHILLEEDKIRLKNEYDNPSMIVGGCLGSIVGALVGGLLSSQLSTTMGPHEAQMVTQKINELYTQAIGYLV